jgi:HAMP domain-containing protein
MSEDTPKKNKKTFRSIASTLSLSVLLLSSGILFIENAITIYFNFQEQQRSIFQKQELVADDAARIVREFIFDRTRTLTDTVAISNLIRLSDNERNIILNRLLKTNSSFRQLAIFDDRGQVLTHESQLSSAAFTKFAKRVDNALFLHVKSGQTHITPVFFDEATNEPLILIAVPIKDTFGDFKGMLIGEINLKFMWDVVANLKVGEHGTAYVVDNEGYLLAFTDTSRVLKRENLKELREVNDFIGGKDEGSERRGEVLKGINGTDVVSTYVRVAEEPAWAIIVELPLAEAYGPIINQLLISFSVLLVSIVLIILLSRLLAQRITKPIIRLRDAAKQISTGNLNTTIEVTSQDEIGELSEAFNQMATQLKQYYSNLETQVKEKTEQVLKQMEETGRMNKLMVGRELRMVELKRENETLRQKLGMPIDENVSEKKQESNA